MESTPRPSIPGSQRTLAAILFTDVVGFSARMQKAEVRTLELLQKDFAVMRQVCSEHEGAVLKTTGDGLLMRFTSAVQAVACALAMQQAFADAAKGAVPKDALQHRIGIHLGDILVQDQDVMGDGVNIASRIQGEAEPGGICISQTVLDVVKNKLELKVVSLGARELKNITEAMPVYRLLLAAQELGSKSPFPTMREASASPGPSVPARTAGRKPYLWAGVGAAVALAIGVGAFVWNRTQRSEPEAPPVADAGTASTEARNRRDKFGNQVTGGRKAVAGDLMLQLREQYQAQLDRYDFEGILAALRADKRDETNRPAVQLFTRSVEQMQELKTWTATTMKQQHPRNRPLRVPPLAGSAPEVNVFLGADNRMHFPMGGGLAALELTELKPPMLANIVVAVLRETPGAVPRDVIVGAQAFSRIYNLPAMQEALTNLRPRREKN